MIARESGSDKSARAPDSTSAKQSVAGVTKSGKYVTLRVQLSIQSCRVDLYVGMRLTEATNSLWGSDEAKEANTDTAGSFQGTHR